MLDFTEIKDYGEFFAWYLCQIRVYAPDYLALTPEQMHKKIPNLTKDEMDAVVKQINKIQKVPKGIIFKNDNSAGTFYSFWDKQKEKAVIAFPSVIKWMLRYPGMVKIVIQHEMGHIINKDIFVRIPKHGSCTNKCMDCRINQNLNYDLLEKVCQCLFSCTTTPAKQYMIVPETFLEDKCGIPVGLKDKIGWKEIHNAYHNYNKTMSEDADEMPEEGQFIITLKEFGEVDEEGNGDVFPKTTLGIITGRKATEETFLYTCTKMTEELETAFLAQDYPTFLTIMRSGNIYDKVIGSDMIYKKDFIVIQPPQLEENTPKVSDFVLFIEPITSRGDKPSYGIVIGDAGDKTNFDVLVLSDDMQNAIYESDRKKMVQLIQSNSFMTTEIVKAQFPDEITVIDLGLGGGKSKKADAKINKKKEPMIGDVIYVSTGAEKEKYGIIKVITKSIDGDDFEVKEIDEKKASLILGR